MSRNWIVMIAVIAFAVLGTACTEAEKATESAGAALDKTAEQAGQVAEATMEDLMERAKAAAGSLDAEAKVVYDQVMSELSQKQGKLTALKDKIGQMKPQEMISEGGATLKADAEKLTTEIGALKTKLEDVIAKAG